MQVFGTDGDPTLNEALSHNFHSAKQLRCFIHLKRNVTEKLRDRGIPNSETQQFLADVFGRRSGNTYEEGLVDSNDADDFDAWLASCESIWLTREGLYAHQGQVTFFQLLQDAVLKCDPKYHAEGLEDICWSHLLEYLLLMVVKA